MFRDGLNKDNKNVNWKRENGRKKMMLMKEEEGED